MTPVALCGVPSAIILILVPSEGRPNQNGLKRISQHHTLLGSIRDSKPVKDYYLTVGKPAIVANASKCVHEKNRVDGGVGV